MECSELVGMARAFMSDDRELRRKKLSRFENGDFDNITRTYGLYKKLTYEEAIRQAQEKKSQEDPGEMISGVIDATESGISFEFNELVISLISTGLLAGCFIINGFVY